MPFNWQWRLSDGYPEKNGLNVYSCFACGGGSTMGYKLAGYTVIGANDIDPKMAMIYKENHHPKYHHLMDIRALTELEDIPPEMFNLDILDGSPPCSTFSIAGSREAAWGKEKKFREGQAAQRLDDLFFRFLELADRLKPKVIVAENVKGMLVGKAKNYVVAIQQKMQDMGYDTQIFLFNGATMGVPQRRERVFFVGRRKDLRLPPLQIAYNEKPIQFYKIRTEVGDMPTTHVQKLLQLRQPKDKDLADISMREHQIYSGFNAVIVKDVDVFPTITATGDNYRAYDGLKCTDTDYIHAGTFPEDYDFMGQSPKYVIGMSVPPLMVAHLARDIARQWFNR